MNFTINFTMIGPIFGTQTIAIGHSIRELKRLNKTYGKARWKKMKGIAKIVFSDGTMSKAELHWYQAHGFEKKEIKIKRILE